jgi:hypothetical protein
MKGFLTTADILLTTVKGPFYLVLPARTIIQNLFPVTKQKYRQTLPCLSNSLRLFSRFLLIIGVIIVSASNLKAGVYTFPADTPQVQSAHVAKGLDAQVFYSADDSMFFDLDNQLVYLYDSARVDYGDIHLLAHFVIIDFRNNTVEAEASKDSLGNYTDKVQFNDGEQSFEAEKMKYNYTTGKGKISEVATEQGQGFLHADVVKKAEDSIIFAYRGVYTTCDLEHPHFAIRARKMKMVQDDEHGKIVTGPAYLEVADVPTPLGIPFGFFPNKKGRSSGVLIPTYGESPSLGFFLRDGGYYWGVSDKMDMALRGDIYSHGSWGAKLFTNYKVRYKYGGNIALKYSRIITGDRELPTHTIRNDFQVNWTHTQDPKANPSVRFSANVKAGTSNYNTYNSNLANDYLSNTFQSNVAWSKSWKFGSLSTALRHSQNNITHNVDVTLPQVAFAVNRFYPLRNPKRLKKTWYTEMADKLGISYTSEFQNKLNIGDSSIRMQYSDYIINHFNNGIRQSLPISTSMNLLRHFTLTPAFIMNSVTQFRTIHKSWTGNDIAIDTVSGARASFDWNVSATLSTKFYGMFYPKHTRYSAIRHTVTPNLVLTYMPDFSDPKYGFYKYVQNSATGSVTKYSIFEGGIYGASAVGNTGSVGINLLNSLEGKKRLKDSDTTGTAERVSLIDAFNFAIAYNIMAEHFKWSMLTSGFRTKLFKRFDVNASFTADPYRMNENGVRIERFEWRTYKRLVRLTGATMAIGTSLRKGGLSSTGNYNSNRGTEQEMNMINSNPNAYVDFNIPWSLNVSYNLTWSKPLMTETVTQNIRFSGDLNVTPKWKIGFDSNYDIKKQEFGYTSLNVYRDLHCWELQFNWIPFGIRQSYNLTINVKSSVLQDLRLTRKRDWYDFSAQ